MSVQTVSRAEAQARDGKKERAEKIDFKMVTFSLGGKEYGIDIMNIKEIAKAGRFTYVPNAAPFVRGVYNLRGDIISIIDLRTMFHLPAGRKSDDSLESLLILRVDDHVFGVIVDSIDKVVGISQSGIQPPHPIFGDINVKYIKGIIENQGKLYIILNVEKLFSPKKEEVPALAVPAAIPLEVSAQLPLEPAGNVANVDYSNQAAPADAADLNVSFVRETLFTFRHFGVSDVNETWFTGRYKEWCGDRKPSDIQLREPADADSFLQSFVSPCTGELWSAEYSGALSESLPRFESNSIHVWNPGCGKGYETYSLACLLRSAYPQARIKIWANDSDLLSISMAPNMVFAEGSFPESYISMMVQGKNGWSFNQTIRDSIFFEFHDVLNSNPVPSVDIVLCRDTVSFLSPNDQIKLLGDFIEKTKRGGAVIMGYNESMPAERWKSVGDSSVFIKLP